MFENESEVRVYSRSFPLRISRSKNCRVYDKNGKPYLDFLSGCGSLNYGHNCELLKKSLLEYVAEDGITMSMDLLTEAKYDFIEAFVNHILKPRNLFYKFQFTGPTGANAVEASLKLARKITGRSKVIAFTNGYHGVSIGALSLTGNKFQRKFSQDQLIHVERMPYDGYLGDSVDTMEYFIKCLDDPSSGVDKPAAVILEMVQAEGGLNYASIQWIKKLSKYCKSNNIILIIDDIQAGCGRSGKFFSFEESGIYPDMVCMAKSLSGYGLPMSMLLIKPELDIWSPGEHNGTFRGNNLAFVTGKAAVNHFWLNNDFEININNNANFIQERLKVLSSVWPEATEIKGKGMMQGILFKDPDIAKKIQSKCFENGLIVELCGPYDETLKLFCPLNIDLDSLTEGLEIIKNSTDSVIRNL